MPTVTRVRKLVLELNQEAMNFIGKNDVQSAMNSLNQALETIKFLAENETASALIEQLNGLTYNNLACVHK
jgi:hypothetical protein